MIGVLFFVAPDLTPTPPQHQVRIIVIVTTSFNDEEIIQCQVHDGDACDRHHGMTEIALIRMVKLQ